MTIFQGHQIFVSCFFGFYSSFSFCFCACCICDSFFETKTENYTLPESSAHGSKISHKGLLMYFEFNRWFVEVTLRLYFKCDYVESGQKRNYHDGRINSSLTLVL